jgi:AraC-like DNA-binding protein
MMAEASWLLRPVLRRVGSEKPVQRLVRDWLGPSAMDEITNRGKLPVPRPRVFELLEVLAEMNGAPDLGLEAIGRRPPETLVDYVMITSATVGDCLAALARINRLNTDARNEIEVRGRRLIIRQHLGTDRARQFGEGLSGSVAQLIRTGAGPGWAPIEVRFPHPRPARAAALEEHFRCPLYFDAATFELHVGREDAALPLVRRNPQLHTLLLGLAAGEIARLPEAPDSVVVAARAALREGLSQRQVSLEAVADQLKMTVRTFQRRLDDEGVDYRTLVDDERRALATQLLSESTRTVSEVASMLGFGNVTSLHRAVRRWTGRTPGSLRKDPAAPDTES